MTIDLHVEAELVAAGLDRHERRRERGLPTISVLAGPGGLALRQAGAWAQARGRSVVRVVGLDSDAAIDSWAARLDTEQDLSHAAVAWLARRLGQPEADLGPRLRRMTPFERETFLDDALAEAAGTGLDHVGRRLLSRLVADSPPAPEPGAADLAEPLVVAGLPRRLLATALLELLPVRTAPLLLIAAASPEVPGEPTLERWAELAAGLVQAEPGLTVLLVADTGTLDAYLSQPAENRARALVRESVVPVPALDRDALRRRLDGCRPGLVDALAGPVARLSTDGASEELADLFVAAAWAADDISDGGPDAVDRARSAAERFLFERLASLPETAGQFRLNARPGFRFDSGQLLEVDLLADALRLAIEVDGYYHFRDADAYRRDRRKDLELQRRGYLVVRVLADDVVHRLEEVLETILGLVEHQTRPAPRS